MARMFGNRFAGGRTIRVLSRFDFRLNLKFTVMYVFFDDSSNKFTTIVVPK